MKTLTEQLKYLGMGDYVISQGLIEEIIKIVKERDAFIIGKGEEFMTGDYDKDRRASFEDELRAEQCKRAVASL